METHDGQLAESQSLQAFYFNELGGARQNLVLARSAEESQVRAAERRRQDDTRDALQRIERDNKQELHRLRCELKDREVSLSSARQEAKKYLTERNTLEMFSDHCKQANKREAEEEAFKQYTVKCKQELMSQQTQLSTLPWFRSEVNSKATQFDLLEKDLKHI